MHVKFHANWILFYYSINKLIFYAKFKHLIDNITIDLNFLKILHALSI